VVQLGLVQVAPNADKTAVARSLREVLPRDDVEVLTREDFVWQEMLFWLRNTPIGFIFGLGLIVGFIVGVVICYQILGTSVADHLAEYATLKAIGYSNHYLTRVVLGEALVLSLLGFGVGVSLGTILYGFLGGATGLPLELNIIRTGFILALTIAMSALSGFLALGRVRSADPAEVF
jgi:putative ABC transport system permease protein